MRDALTRSTTVGLQTFLLSVTIALPLSAAQQGMPPPDAQKLASTGGAYSTVSAWDSVHAATAADLIRKRLELIRQVNPDVARIAVVWQPSEDIGHPLTSLQDVGKAASALGLSVRFVAAADVAQLEAGFSDISTGDVDAILVVSGRMLLVERAYVVQLVAKTGLPAVYDAREFVESGGLMSYGPNLTEPEQYGDLFASNTEDLAKTARTDQPVKLELVVNIKAATKLGLTLTPEFLAIVDKIVK
jgi:putative ABC transport system substrate-binding protein